MYCIRKHLAIEADWCENHNMESESRDSDSLWPERLGRLNVDPSYQRSGLGGYHSSLGCDIR